MSRPAARTLAAAALVVAACSIPTGMCGCPPLRSAVVVVGTVTDVAGAALVGARVHVDGVPPTLSSEPPMMLNVPGVTDTDGRFRAAAYSVWGGPDLTIRAAVIAAGSTDTIRIRTGAVATFRPENERLDAVRVALHIP